MRQMRNARGFPTFEIFILSFEPESAVAACSGAVSARIGAPAGGMHRRRPKMLNLHLRICIDVATRAARRWPVRASRTLRRSDTARTAGESIREFAC